jgi:hypothetical protein
MLKSPKIGFQQPKYSLRFGDVLLNTAKVIFEAHRGPRGGRNLVNLGYLTLGARLLPRCAVESHYAQPLRLEARPAPYLVQLLGRVLE